MSDPVGNPEYRFSHNEAHSMATRPPSHMHVASCYNKTKSNKLSIIVIQSCGSSLLIVGRNNLSKYELGSVHFDMIRYVTNKIACVI